MIPKLPIAIRSNMERIIVCAHMTDFPIESVFKSIEKEGFFIYEDQKGRKLNSTKAFPINKWCEPYKRMENDLPRLKKEIKELKRANANIENEILHHLNAL